MKSYLTGIFAIAVSLLMSCGDGPKGEKIEPADVPPPIVTSLNNTYPGAADVTWEKEEEDGRIIYEADFKYDGKKMDARYDETGAPVNDD